MQGRNRCGGRGLAMLFAPLCVTQVLTEAQESRDRLMTGVTGPRSYLEVQLRVPYSFPLEEEGAGGEKKASMTSPRPLQNSRPLTPTYLWISRRHCSVPRGGLIMHWLPNMIQTFLPMSRQKANYSVYFNVMRLVQWNSPELEWNNNFSAHILSNTFITTLA